MMEGYVVVRAHGLKSRLLRKVDYEQIVSGEKEINTFRDYLLISDKDTLEEKLEKIYRVYISRISPLAEASPELSPFIFALLDRLEFENLKIHLRYMLGYARPVIYYPYGRHFGPAKISSIKTEASVWEALAEKGILSIECPKFTTELVAEREAFLDVLYYAYLLRQLEETKLSKSEKSELRETVKSEASIYMAYWEKVLNPQIVEKLVEHFKLDIRPAQIDMEGESTTDLLRAISETIMRQIIARVEAKHFITLPYVYAFNFYARLEAQNLEKIILGKTIGLPSDILLRSLVYLE
jgi:hypothetical protein